LPPPPQKGIRARKGLKGVNALVQVLFFWQRLKENVSSILNTFFVENVSSIECVLYVACVLDRILKGVNALVQVWVWWCACCAVEVCAGSSRTCSQMSWRPLIVCVCVCVCVYVCVCVCLMYVHLYIYACLMYVLCIYMRA